MHSLLLAACLPPTPGVGDVFDLLQPARFAVASELMRRGHDGRSLRHVVEHAGHVVFTSSYADECCPGGWSVMCECGLAINELASLEDTHRAGEEHIAHSGGCWQPKVDDLTRWLDGLG